MTDLLHERDNWAAPATHTSLEEWLVAIATALVALFVLGVVPHVNW